MIFDICNKNYYKENDLLYKTNSIELLENKVYVLTGCNGLGKSTLIHQITEDRKTSLKHFAYNLLHDYNGYSRFKHALSIDDDKKQEYDTYYLSINIKSYTDRTNDCFSDIAYNFRSQGEKLLFNMIPCLQIVNKELNRLKNKTLYLFLDDLDVGISLDVIEEEKHVVEKFIKKLKENNTKYVIVIAANNYELTKLGTCIDCITLKPINFKDYDNYKSYVVKTREYKEKRNGENKDE